MKQILMKRICKETCGQNFVFRGICISHTDNKSGIIYTITNWIMTAYEIANLIKFSVFYHTNEYQIIFSLWYNDSVKKNLVANLSKENFVTDYRENFEDNYRTYVGFWRSD